VAEFGNHTVRKIVIATGAAVTIAGTAGTAGSTDGPGATARFFNPAGITTDGTNLYVADFNNNTIRKIDTNGNVTTIAGNAAAPPGSADGTGSAANFYGPYGIATDGTNLYVTDSFNSTIRTIELQSGKFKVRTIAGIPGTPGFADGIGAAATFNGPSGIATYGTNLYVADTYNSTIREIF